MTFEENREDYRVARDHDMRLGLQAGVLAGLLAGSSISRIGENEYTPLSRIIARRVLFGGAGAVAGGFLGSKIAAELYDSKKTDELLEKLQNHIEDRLLAGQFDFKRNEDEK